MLSNYLKIAVRQLWHNRLFSLLNIVGLTVGLAVSTFIGLYVWHEFHYDRFHPFADRTYRIMSAAKYGEDVITMPQLHESFGREAKRQLPEVEQFVRFWGGSGPTLLEFGDNHYKEDEIGFADASMLTVMGFRMRQGDAQTALSQPGRIVLTRRLAEKYFGNANPVGKTMLYDKQYPLQVTGVLDDLPTNSVLQFNALVSISSIPSLAPKLRDGFEHAGIFDTYLVLRAGTNAAITEKKLAKINTGIKFTDLSATFSLEPLPSLHLDSRGASIDSRTGISKARQTLYIFLSIALLILVLAIINYVSLATARATKRAREVGVRKAVGGLRSELIGQFYTESFLTTTLAFLLSIFVLQAMFPWANQALDMHMDNRVLSQTSYWGIMLALWLSCSLIASSYPALLLSGFRPHEVLKGTMSSGREGAGVRRLFTTVQFATSVGLLLCSCVFFMQMRYLRTKSLGINRAQVVAINVDADMAIRFIGFRDAVRQWAGRDNVAATNTALFTNNIMTYFLDDKKTKKQLMVNALSVDEGFFKMLGVHWANPPTSWGKRPVGDDLTVYNQTVIRETGLKGNPVGQPDPFFNKPIDGVTADFHIRSLHGPVSPMMLTVVGDNSRSVVENGGYLLVRLNAFTDVPKALDHLKTLYNQQQPALPFDYYFLDDAYNRLYAKEDQLARLFNAFTGLTLLVACLGLLGLMTFNVEARTKEIGIRKVLGASVASIVTLLSKDFVKLVLLSILIASPIAWYAINQWLEDFAYKIDMAWWMFALAGGLALSIALLTISFQGIKAALMNPVKSLRSE
ncbi:FtsX-like permease family protein [Spirosoma soli]|uniref:FtsX-like permease family protein n=1 Tax=Spirosoma soli TaxID=1770529 RepID=A0ABW5M1U5_9BACT